ncbi:MAG: LPS-assembly protein LptD [Burkholderiaceae bacterium]
MKNRPSQKPTPLTPLARHLPGILSALAVSAGVVPGLALAQSEAPTIRLQTSPLLEESLTPEALERAPVFVSGEQIEGQTDGATVIEGEAELRRHDTVIRADRLEYDRRDGQTRATGNVLVNSNGDRFQGPSLEMNVDTHKGTFEQPTFELLRNEGQGDASRLEFLDKDHVQVHDARYSTCPRPPGGGTWDPDWLVRAGRIDLDNVEEMGTAVGGVIEFKGVPILGAPYLTFPLSDKRKSGVLPPSIGLDSQSGLEVTVPYYLNLAPNFDATLYPTIMSKRGIDLGGEFRYLEPSYTGQLRAAWTPDDKLRDQDRWSYAFQHRQMIQSPIGLRSPLSLRVNLNRVSDNNYWRDYPRALSSLTSRLLASEATLGWSQGPWSASLGAHAWQTLQDPDSRITPPFDRLPTLSLAHRRTNQTIAGLSGWDWSIRGEATRFERSILATTGEETSTSGDRTLAVGEITRRWQAPGWFVQPKFRLHATRYDYTGTAGQSLSASRVLPTFSTDSGLIFERQASFFGRSFVQTLEPRAFFTWTPYKNQIALPNYDSSNRDFNLSTMFTEHTIGGNDRITDTRAIALGVTSRLFDPDSGGELLRLGLAQRFLLEDQNVTLSGRPITEHDSDVLLHTRVNWSPTWSTELNLRYRPSDDAAVRTTLGARYMPGPYRLLSVTYRLQNDVSEQYDFGWQWPLSDLLGSAPDPVKGKALGPGQWYSVGRMNYSVPDKKVIDMVAGFEYDAGCWIGRVVLERLQLNSSSANERVLFQLEFSGFSRLGGSSLKTLSDQIPRYQYLREEVNPPSRFENYD